MAIVTRLILALLLVVQSCPWIGAERCAEMAGRAIEANVGTPSPDEERCSCCSTSGAGKTECSNGDVESVCCCGVPQPEEPKSPASERKVERVAFVASALSTMLGVVHRDVAPAVHGWQRLVGAPKRPVNSIQAVLCIWLV